MKIDIKDDNILQLSCALSGAYGAHFLGWPAKAQDFHMPALEPKSNTVGRSLGLSILQSTAITLVAAKADGAAKKDLMKVAGACWGASAINTAWGTHKGNLKENRGWANAAVQAGMAGLLLWRGTSNKSKI